MLIGRSTRKTPQSGARTSGWRRVQRPLAALPIAFLALLVLTIGDGGGGPARAETSVRDVILNPESLADPSTLIDIGSSTFDAVVVKFLPDELPIIVPGLGDLGPVTMDDATITVERPTDPFQVGGWKVTIDDTVLFEIDGVDHPLTFSIGLEWETAAGDFSPIVEFEVSAPDPLRVADVLSFSSHLAAAAASQETLAADTSISNVAINLHWDADGAAPRSWFDVIGTTTFGTQDIAVSYLFSYDMGGPRGTHFITGVRVDNTDPDAETVALNSLISGDWGAIASDIELPEFVLAKVSGLPPNETLSRQDLRLGGLPLKFFRGCDSCGTELPEDFELDATVTLLAKIDLEVFGDVVADAFDYPDNDSTVDLYGKLGLDFSSIEGTTPVSLDQVKLRAEVPESGGLNDLLPDWLSVGAWTLTVDYSSDPLIGGITVGAQTELSADVDGDLVPDFVFDTTATFTRTTDGTISIGLAALSTETWNDPFGIDWLDLTSLGIGGSFTRTEAGDTAFDAALTSTFELCEDPCSTPSIGRVEARIGVTTDTQVEFRLAFGEDGSSVPIGALLGPIAQQFGASPDLTGEIGALELDDLVFAVSVDSSGSVTFESFASANLGVFDDVTSYFYVEAGSGTPRFFFGARPTAGVTLAQLLAPASTDPEPPEVLSTIGLPTLGIVAAPVGGFESPSDDLSRDGFEFFRPLYGCAEDATPLDCSFTVDLEPGINAVANIAFPGELSTLAEALWLDADSGIQFQGTLALPGLFDPGAGAEVKLGLRLTLPKLEPLDAVEFIEDGSLTLGIELETSATPKIALYVEGLLNTRWRRGSESVEAGDPCPLTSVPLPLYEDPDASPNPSYCYDRLTFRVKSELALTPGGVNVSLLGALSAPNGWQQPFGAPGLEWLVINDLVVKVDVQVPGVAGSAITVNAGFLGEIEIDNGDAALPNTVLQASFGAGVSLQPIPGPPTVTFIPNFKGVRAYVSRIGMADVALMQQMIFPDAGDFDLSSLPNVEFQNLEFMFAIASDADLCLEPRIGFAGELWIDPQRDGGGGDVPDVPDDETCRPFGAGVDPATCLTNRELGCFASIKATIGLDGIFAAGSVGEFEIGPVKWEGGLIDLRLKLGEAPIVAVSGGVAVDGLGSGRLAMKLELLPVAKVEFFGYLEAFDAFEVQVDGKLELRLDPLWPPQLKSDMELHAALRADFETHIRNQIVSELEAIAGSLDDLDEALELLARDPMGNLAEARDALAAAGVDLPDWMNGLIDYIEFVDEELLPANASPPTYDQIINGEPYDLTSPAFRSCNWFDSYDAQNDECTDSDGNTYEPDLYCLPFVELDPATKSCVVTIVMPDVGEFLDVALPTSWNQALEDLYDEVTTAIQEIDLVPNISGIGIEEYLYELADQIEQTQLLSVDCAEFTWTGGDGAGDVRVLLLVTVLSQQYGFDVQLDLTNPAAGVKSVVGEMLELFLTFGEQDVDCDGEQPTPIWLEAVGGGTATPTELTLDPTGPVDEGDPVTVSGTISPAATTPIDIIVDWGDGDTETLTDVTGGTFGATHTYPDDNPTGTDGDDYAVEVSTDDAAAPALTTVRVRNVAPSVTITNLVSDGEFEGFDAEEGTVTTLTIEFDDVAADTHGVVVSWGDGATTTVLAATSPVSLTHTYLDDDPTATPVDIVTDGIRVTVTDDDLGETTATADLRVSNVVPAVGFTGATVGADGVAELSVQYSDPLGGDPSTGSIEDFRIVADDVAADSLALRMRFDGVVGPSTWLQTGSPTCVTAGPVHQTCTWSVSAVPDPVSGIHTDIAPGTYDLVLNVVDDDTGTAGVTLRITVLPEDARIWYSGPTMVATESAASGEAELELRATVRDITSAVPPTDPQWDPWAGDIRTATMRFVDRDSSGPSLCQTASVDEVFSPFDPFDPSASIGVGTCDWEAVINGDASEYTVASVIGGNYTRDRTKDDNVVVVARPLDDFITGGGFLVLTDSDGAYAGDDGTHANFGFHVKFNKRGTNLQGGATIIIRSDDRVYKIKSNSTTSLGVDGNAAQFEAKANLVDVTDEANTVSIAGNLVLQMRMVDVDEAGDDEVGFALWDIQRTGNGKNATTTQLLLFSSNWSGEETELQRIEGGNLMVH